MSSHTPPHPPSRPGLPVPAGALRPIGGDVIYLQSRRPSGPTDEMPGHKCGSGTENSSDRCALVLKLCHLLRAAPLHSSAGHRDGRRAERRTQERTQRPGTHVLCVREPWVCSIPGVTGLLSAVPAEVALKHEVGISSKPCTVLRDHSRSCLD